MTYLIMGATTTNNYSRPLDYPFQVMVVKKTSDPFKLRNYGNVLVKDV